MLSQMPFLLLLRRLWDAELAYFAVLFGRRSRKSMPAISRARHSAEVAMLIEEVGTVLEKMNMTAARLAKRESRAAKAQLEAEAPLEQQVEFELPVNPKERKAALRARIRSGRGRRLRTPASADPRSAAFVGPPAPTNGREEEEEP